MLLTKDMIKALRSGNPYEISKYDDLYPVNIDGIINNAKNIARYEKEMEDIYNSRKYQILLKKNEIISELQLLMINIGIDNKIAYDIAKKIVDKYGINTDIDILRSKIAEEINSIKDSKNNKENKKTKSKRKNASEKTKVNNNEYDENGYEYYMREGKIKT